jgi:hypothetical protein
VLSLAGGVGAGVAGCLDSDDGTATPTGSTAAVGGPGTPAQRQGTVTAVSTDDDLAGLVNDASGGETFVLESGVHEVDRTIESDASGVSIVGQGVHMNPGEPGHETTVTRTGDFTLFELVGLDTRNPDVDGSGADRVRNWLFRDLTISGGSGNDSDIVDARYNDNHRFENVTVHGWGTSGNGIRAEECWDWKFDACLFSNAGSPDRETADIYAYNGDYDNTNNFVFTNCRFENVGSRALYSDHSGEGSKNGRFYFTNCKFHGFNNDNDNSAEQYYLAGQLSHTAFLNCWFIWSRRGFIHAQNGSKGLMVQNCTFYNAQEPVVATEKWANGVMIANNEFHSYDGQTTPAIRTVGRNVTIANNTMTGDCAGIEVSGENTVVTGNVLEEPPGDGIVFRGGTSIVNANVVRAAGGTGIRSGQGASDTLVYGNVVAGSADAGIDLGGDGVRSDLNLTR